MELKLFDIKEKKAFATESCYVIKPLANLIDLFPKYYLDIFAYVHFMTSLNIETNPYRDFPEETKAESIIKDVNPLIDPLDENIKKAVNCVKDIYKSNTHYRAFLSKKVNFENYLRLLENEEWTTGKDGSTAALLSANKAFQEMKAAYDTAEADYMKNVLNVKTWAGQKNTFNAKEVGDED